MPYHIVLHFNVSFVNIHVFYALYELLCVRLFVRPIPIEFHQMSVLKAAACEIITWWSKVFMQCQPLQPCCDFFRKMKYSSFRLPSQFFTDRLHTQRKQETKCSFICMMPFLISLLVSVTISGNIVLAFYFVCLAAIQLIITGFC